MSRVYNFNPGPSALPLSVLEHAQQELLDYQGTGMSVMEMSHRSKEYEAINQQAIDRAKALYGLGDDYRVLFVQGGASLQFAMVPMNFLHSGKVGNYVMTGSWSEKALKEAKLIGAAHEAASTKGEGYTRIPTAAEIAISDNAAYVHTTLNNTIFGTQWHYTPDTGDVPLISDVSSDLFSRPLELAKYALVYGGAQKNFGPSGVTMVLVRASLLEQENPAIPVILRYSTHESNNSLYNTPPTFGVYLVGLILGWIEQQGGLAAVDALNRQKAGMIYDLIDANPDFFRCPVQADSRSLMNIVFRLPSEELEAQFIKAATAAGMVGLKGHRSVGGIRVSLYNAVPLAAAESLAAFMREFLAQHG